MKILIVDDKKENRLLLEALLKGNGYTVTMAENGKEALKRLRNEPFDLIVSDILMPVMDGFQLCRYVKSDETLKHIPFVFYTATYTDKRDEELAMRLGADRFLRKPMEPYAFLEVISEIVKDIESGKIAPREPAEKEEAEEEEEEEIFKLYNERLVKKLEKKMQDLERELALRKKAEEEIRKLSTERKEMESDLRIWNEVAHIFLTTPDDTMYEKVLALIMNITGSKYGIFGFIDEAGDWVCPSLTRDIWEQCQIPNKSIVFRRDKWGGLWGKAMTEKTSLYSNQNLNFPAGHIIIDNALDVPILQEDRLIGNFVVGQNEKGFDEKSKSMLGTIAAQVAPILSARLARDEEYRERKKAEDQLLQAQKMEAIGTLAGGIAHDFNNILSAIIGYTELTLIDPELTSSLKENLSEVVRAGERARQLVSQILAFSRQMENRMAPVPIHLIVREAIKLLKATLPATITVRATIGTFAQALADPGQIHQVVMNLCTNAFHAMREKGGRLEVELTEAEVSEEDSDPDQPIEPGSYLRLRITDTGIGMDETVRQRIFEPYFTTKRKGEGTGLGLSVVYGIVQSHHGKVTVTSQTGQGSTFTVYLPKLETSKAAPANGMREEAQLPVGSEQIMVIDDEPTIGKIYRNILTALGYRVVVFTDPRDALTRFRLRPEEFDLVITDMTMPGVTGDVLASEMLRIRPELPIILCTGFSEKIDEARAAALGLRALILKPINRASLARRVRDVLDGRKG